MNALSSIRKLNAEGNADGNAIGNAGFTSDDCDAIRDYVTYASSLPVVPQAVEVFVGYKRAGVAGLEPSELGTLFEQVRRNADAWDPARDLIAQQTGALAGIADRVVPSGDALIRAIRAMPFCTAVLASVGSDLSDLPALDIPDEPLTAADVQSKRPLIEQLARLRKIHLEQVDRSGEAMRLMAIFRDGVKALEPVVAGKRAALKNSGLEQIGHEVTVEPMIAVLQREYDRTVRIEGPDAVVALAKRRELDAAIQALKSQIDLYRARQRVTYAMGRLFVHFTELGVVMVGAEVALGHLWLAWREAGAALDSASHQFEQIDSSRKLLTFLSEFQTLINEWKQVRERATELNGAF